MAIAVVVGAKGAIGAALCKNLSDSGRFDEVLQLSRQSGSDIVIDIQSEDSVGEACKELANVGQPIAFCAVATGILHNEGNSPERSITRLDMDWMLKSYLVNAAAPALLAKYLLPIMPRNKLFTLAFLSARVGSISDNRLGGWHSYRASKAALNMIIRNLAIEWARKNPLATIVGIHPGTVESNLSQPFLANIPSGQLFSPEQSASKIMCTLNGLTPEESGKIFAWDGSEIRP